MPGWNMCDSTGWLWWGPLRCEQRTEFHDFRGAGATQMSSSQAADMSGAERAQAVESTSRPDVLPSQNPVRKPRDNASDPANGTRLQRG